ncbi:MAG: hypothetical protein KY456_14520 [Chloroflexi bacterium]|nr:hypothetical protein [Chloroflexota bacterium]
MTGFAMTEVLVSIYDDFAAGNLDRARETFYRYVPLIRYEGQQSVGLAIRKEILKRCRVLTCAAIRSPEIRLDDQGQAEVARLLADLDVSVA